MWHSLCYVPKDLLRHNEMFLSVLWTLLLWSTAREKEKIIIIVCLRLDFCLMWNNMGLTWLLAKQLNLRYSVIDGYVTASIYGCSENVLFYLLLRLSSKYKANPSASQTFRSFSSDQNLTLTMGGVYEQAFVWAIVFEYEHITPKLKP